MIFASVAVEPDDAAVAKILTQGRSHNARQGITGVLCHGHGIYLQLMEGNRSAVNQIYAKVLQDPRHRDAELLYFAEIQERGFANWTLGHVRLEKLNASAVLKYAERLPLQLDALNGAAVRAMLLDLAATAAIAHK
ncbi:BLUF domain-containing protein [Corticibacter populi]